jgi:hypothetical protein
MNFVYFITPTQPPPSRGRRIDLSFRRGEENRLVSPSRGRRIDLSPRRGGGDLTSLPWREGLREGVKMALTFVLVIDP